MKGKVNIDGIEYDVEVKNGERFIDGKTIDEFIKILSENQLLRAANVGIMALKDEKKGIKPAKGKYQYFINEPLKEKE